MMPAIPITETTNPKPWQAVTAMVDMECYTTEGQHSSESTVWRGRSFLGKASAHVTNGP